MPIHIGLETRWRWTCSAVELRLTTWQKCWETQSTRWKGTTRLLYQSCASACEAYLKMTLALKKLGNWHQNSFGTPKKGQLNGNRKNEPRLDDCPKNWCWQSRCFQCHGRHTGVTRASQLNPQVVEVLWFSEFIADGPVSRILCGVAVRMARCKPRQSFL